MPRLSPVAPILLLVAVHSAFGLAGVLEKASLALPAKVPNGERVLAVLADKRFKFLGGSYINSHTKLNYEGDAASLNAFLSALGQCEGFALTVTFTKEVEEVAWTLSHTGWVDPQALHVTVNTGRIAQAAVISPAPGAARK